MGKKTKDEFLEQLVTALRPLIEREVTEILAEKLREDPGLLELIRAGAAEADRQDFKDRSILK